MIETIEPLVEREAPLAALHDLLARTLATSEGHVALVSGEAGAGKTTLVARFIADDETRAAALWGSCDALYTPRPLGPLYDIAPHLSPRLRAALERHDDRAAIFSALLDEFQRPGARPITIFEDVHWADEATLDLIKYLGRRMRQARTLLILTYRDDEVGASHPLASVLGDLPPRDVTRLCLLPLSARGVAALALRARGSAEGANELYAATGGNPFFVTEALASGASGVPETVRDAALARAGRLPASARAALDVVAVAPGRMERWVAEAAGVAAADLDTCLESGLLRLDHDAYVFRHELSRLAIESALPAGRKRALNGGVLRALLEATERSVDAARLAHHAAQAGERALVARYAPEAAQQAAAQGARREAAAHYRAALDAMPAAASEERAVMLDALAYECYLTSQAREAAQACEQALAIWRLLDMPEKIGHTLRRLSRLHWFLGDHAMAARFASQAILTLEAVPHGRELAMAYSNCAHLYMLDTDRENAVLWGERAIALAERIGDDETLCHALNNIGTVMLQMWDYAGEAYLLRSLRIARAHGYDEHVARALTNLIAEPITNHDYDRAESYLAEGLAFCAERDLDSWSLYILAYRALERLSQGDWSGAEEDGTAALRRHGLPAAIRAPALTTLGWLRARRGAPDARTVLDEARALALATGELQRIAPVAWARAEAAWLRGDLAGCAAAAREGYELALTRRAPWLLGWLALWLWRADALPDIPPDLPAPFALQIAGDWRAAAVAWERLGRPYEQGLALLDGGEEALRAALAIFERLGAAPVAAITRLRLRETGARHVPRGPRPATRANPRGLTNRQMEILRLLAAGLSNAQIADRLSTSPKTVAHHVSAVLAKLGTSSRAGAIATAHALGLIGARAGGTT